MDKIDKRRSLSMAAALSECYTYNEIGGLNDQMIKDIAYDNGVDPVLLKEEFYK